MGKTAKLHLTVFCLHAIIKMVWCGVIAALLNLTGHEPDSLKMFFFASFDANALVV